MGGGQHEKIAQNFNIIMQARGMSVIELARLSNVSYGAVRSFLKTGNASLDNIITYCEVLGCSMAEALDGVCNPEKFTLSTDLSERYPWNIAVSIFGSKDAVYKVYAPGLIEALDELREKEKQTLIYRFNHGLTLAEVAKEYGVTRERVRQIEAKAMRRLRHPSLARTFLFDTQRKYYEAARERDRLKLENITLADKLNKYCEENNVNVEPLPVENDIDSIPIEDLDLSVRSFNCLRRGGYNTIGDLQKTTIEQLMKVRNLGRKSIDEILEKLMKYGVEVGHDG